MASGRDWVDRRINILNRSGDEVPISISTSVLRGKDGEAVGGVETFRDLSALERLRRTIRQQYTFHDIISKNHAMRRMLDILPDVAASDSTVLVQGATGTGKELVAHAIHNLSSRRANTPLSPSIAERFPIRCWNPSSLGMSKVPSPVPSRTNQVASSGLSKARCSWTKLRTSLPRCR